MLVGAAIGRVLLVVAATQSPQPLVPPAPAGLILGRVVDAGTGRPVSGAIVSLTGGGIGTPSAMTNGSGQFVFRKLPKGRFSLSATRLGYIEGAYGRRAPGATTRSIELDDGQRLGDVTILMWRQAAIAGAVTDEAGEPLIDVTLRVFQRRFQSGQYRYVLRGTVSTDDRGMYRLAALAPGDYVVAFISRQVSVPPDVADLLRSPVAASDPKAQAIMRERMSLGPMGIGAGAPQATGNGPTIRQFDPRAPVPPISPDAASPVFIYPTVFFPNSPTAARAGVVTLESGQERDGVDLSVHPIRASRVSGSVLAADGPASYVTVHLMPDGDEHLPEHETATTMTDGNGTFTLMGVVAGQYVIKVARIPRPPTSLAPPPNMVMTQIQVGGSIMGFSSVNDGPAAPPVPPIPDEPALYSSTPVAVADTDVKDVIVTLQRGGSVSGRVEFDGTSDRPDADAMSRIAILLSALDSTPSMQGAVQVFTDSPLGRVEANGTFKTYGQAPGRYQLLSVRPPSGWTFKSAIAGGRDIADTPFDLGSADIGNVVITFTDRRTKLTGAARTKDGSPDTDALVVLFPTDPGAWSSGGPNRRLRATRPANDGTYTFDALPVGDYYVAAILDGAYSQWQDPQVLAELARTATQVRLADGDTKTQDVVRSGGDR